MTTGRTTRAALKGDFVPARSRRRLSVGQSVRIARELNEMSQNELGNRNQPYQAGCRAGQDACALAQRASGGVVVSWVADRGRERGAVGRGRGGDANDLGTRWRGLSGR